MRKYVAVACWIFVLFGCKEGGGVMEAPGKRSIHLSVSATEGTDPMAVFYYRGAYHLIYNKSVGAGANSNNFIAELSSTDLIRWSESTKAFIPAEKNSILRGGIVLDSNNITGFGTTIQPALVAVLTKSHNQDTRRALPLLAFSRDDGASWTETTEKISFPEAFISNPQNVAITFYETAKKWMMSVVLKDHVELYSSMDLRSWILESELGRDFFPEQVLWKRSCLFPLSDGIHWALLADINQSRPGSPGGTVYFIGYFDGHKFSNLSEQLHWLDYGADFYGSLICIDSSGRRINIPWTKVQPVNSNASATLMTLSRELNLKLSKNEFFLSASPVQELKKMFKPEVKLGPMKVFYQESVIPLISDVSLPVELYLSFDTRDIQKGSFPTRFGVSFWNHEKEHIIFGYDRFGHYYIDQSGLRSSTIKQKGSDAVRMPFEQADSTMAVRMIVDKSMIECFTDQGRLILSSSFSTHEAFDEIKLFSINGNIDLMEAKLVELSTADR